MTCHEYEQMLLPWVDGSLDQAAADAMQAHEAACPACRGRGEAERRFEERIGSALTAVLPERDPADVVRRARSAPGAARPARRLRSARLMAGLAAAAVMLVAVAWYTCIPPFECPYLQAVEAAATTPGTVADGGPELDALAARVHPPDAILGLRRTGAVERTRVDLMGHAVPALRAHYTGADGEVIVVWSDAMGRTPSFRRRTTRDGRTWWVAYERDCNLVAFQSASSRALCTLVSRLPEPALLRLAEALREDDR